MPDNFFDGLRIDDIHGLNIDTIRPAGASHDRCSHSATK